MSIEKSRNYQPGLEQLNPGRFMELVIQEARGERFSRDAEDVVLGERVREALRARDGRPQQAE